MAEEKDFVDRRKLELNPLGTHLIIVLTVFLFFDFVFIGIRLYARKIKKRSLEINDYAILIGFVILIGIYVLEIVEVVYAGLGLEQAWIITNLGPDMYIFILKCAFAANILWNLSIMAIKISILHLYYSLFGSLLWMKRAVWVMIVLTVAFHSSFIVEVFALCKPVAFYWDRGFNIKKGTCGSAKGGQLARFIPGVMSLALDLVIFLLPLPVLWGLKMPTTKKIATSSVFGIAFGIVIVSAVRLKFIFDTDSADYTKSIIKFAITGAMEPMVGIMVCCTPMIAPVLSKITDGRFAMWTDRFSRRGTGRSGPGLSWHHTSQKSFVSSSRSPGTRGFQSLEDGDYPLVRVERYEVQSGMQTPEDSQGWSREAEEGRIERAVDEREKRTGVKTWIRGIEE